MPTHPIRRRLTVALGCLALAAGACATADDASTTSSSLTTSSSTTSSTSSSTTTSSTTTSSTSTTTIPTTTSTTSLADEPLPQNSQDYATATIQAWTSGDSAALERLMTDDAMSNLLDSELDPAAEWQFQRCEGAAGSAYCNWQSPNHSLALQVSNQAASGGEERAVIGVRIDA